MAATTVVMTAVEEAVAAAITNDRNRGEGFPETNTKKSGGTESVWLFFIFVKH